MAPRLNLIASVVLVAVCVLVVSAQDDQFPGLSQANFPGLIRVDEEQAANVTTSQEAPSNETSPAEQQPADQPEPPAEPPTRPPKPSYASTFPPLVHQEEPAAAAGESTQKQPADAVTTSKPATPSPAHEEHGKKQGGGGAEYCGANLALILSGASIVRFLY